MPTLRTIAPGVPFLPALAGLWRERCAMAGVPPHHGIILLPTRRAARELAAAFLDDAAGASLLLPRIVALGALDEAPLALAGALTLPPAVGDAHRRAILARLILARGGQDGAPRRCDHAWNLAGDLATLMDEAERAEVDLRAGLIAAADPAHAAHWEHTVRFLGIVTQNWPAILAEDGLINPAARLVELLDAQAEAWRATPPDGPVLAVGATADIPAVGRLLRVIAGLPHGLVVLPGLDHDLSDEAWLDLDETHPQHGLASLLGALDARREEVERWGGAGNAGRAALLRRAMLPAGQLGRLWDDFAPHTHGLSRLHAADAREEAVAIALLLRGALEQPGARAALVTPDRGLAELVASELRRWGVVADDSAGTALARTPPAAFLRLIAAVLDQDLAPVALLALLKHPLASVGLPPAVCRRRVRALELACLRGPAPAPGCAGLRQALADAGVAEDDADGLNDLVARLEQRLAPAAVVAAGGAALPAAMMGGLIQAAEALADTDAIAGPARLWAEPAGEALATLLAEVLEALPALPADTPDCLPGLLDAVLAGAVTRGRAGGAPAHPRVFIWGLLEARLQHADLLILGGLTEGVWPPASDPGPWMSRPMRARAQLPSAEAQIGQTAHDFWMAACAAPRVVFSAPRKREGAPAVQARWLTRLDALLHHHGGLPADEAAAWARRLDLPAGPARPARPPLPCPTLRARPRRLFVTDVATLLRDPYEVYARRILELDEVPPLEQSAASRDYGLIVHAGLHGLLGQIGAAWPADAARLLAERLREALRLARVTPALAAWWQPRLDRIAAEVDEHERLRRAASAITVVLAEQRGEWILPRPWGEFRLIARADRIERRDDGGIVILDYKTGTLPTTAAARSQLLLEGAMAQAGAFGPAVQGEPRELAYWRLAGDHRPMEVQTVPPAVAEAEIGLLGLLAWFEQADTSYPADPGGDRRRAYARLARTAEWAGVAEEAAE